MFASRHPVAGPVCREGGFHVPFHSRCYCRVAIELWVSQKALEADQEELALYREQHTHRLRDIECFCELETDQTEADYSDGLDD